MDLHVEPAGDVAVVEVLAETIDVSNSDELKAGLAVLTAAHRFAVVDLAKVRYVDSSGCGALVAAMTRFTKLDKPLAASSIGSCPRELKS